MSDKKVNIDELSEGQLLSRSWWEEDGQHYNMCYIDQQLKLVASVRKNELPENVEIRDGL